MDPGSQPDSLTRLSSVSTFVARKLPQTTTNMGQQSWFIGSLRTPNIFVYSCFFARRRAAGIPKASQSLPKASQSLPKPPKASPKLPKASQSIRRVSQSLPETKKREKGSYCDRIESTKKWQISGSHSVQISTFFGNRESE